ncbi:MAG: quinone-dependent dihydroorotate dehydrogenase [Bacteroidia bacterium]
MYKSLLKPLLFQLQPETAHHFTFNTLKILFKIPFAKAIAASIFCIEDKKLEREVFGLKFKNPVGLAAGLDKDAKLYDELSAFGFGFIEIGTVTPVAQAGNEKPRMFRLPFDNALINRMGFNNEGVVAVANRLRKRNKNVIIGGNIGKNKITSNENAISDYEICFNVLFDVVDYFVVNVSSPNTPGLRALQDKEPLTNLLNHLQHLNHQKVKPKPILLKIAPDLTNEQLDEIIEIVITTKLAGIVATNTTVSRENLKTEKNIVETCGAGGLSGKPLTTRSTEVIKYIANKSDKKFAIIGVGGIHSPADAIEKLNAGADLIQLYTGFIYEGPSLAKMICKELINMK